MAVEVKGGSGYRGGGVLGNPAIYTPLCHTPMYQAHLGSPQATHPLYPPTKCLRDEAGLCRPISMAPYHSPTQWPHTAQAPDTKQQRVQTATVRQPGVNDALGQLDGTEPPPPPPRAHLE